MRLLGVKQLTRLLAAPWSADDIEQWLLEQADAFMAAQPTREGLVTFDQRVVEKPESTCAAGLCRVRSDTARWLGRHRVGFSGGPPTRPVVVPGRHWSVATVTGWSGPVLLACCRRGSGWNPTAPGDPLREPARQQQTASQIQLLQELARRWGVHALFVLDRGFAGRLFLHAALAEATRLVVRWPKGSRLVRLGQPATSATSAWQLTAGQRA